MVDIGASSFTLGWRKTPGATGYKITWSPFHGWHSPKILQDQVLCNRHFSVDLIFHLCVFPPGGVKKSEVVSSSTTSFTITGLPASSAYKIQVSGMVRGKEGSPVMVTPRTCESLICCILQVKISDKIPEIKKYLYQRMLLRYYSGSAKSHWI